MDLRLHEALGTSPGYWLRLQTQRDLWAASERAKDRAPVARIARLTERHRSAVDGVQCLDLMHENDKTGTGPVLDGRVWSGILIF
jgi:hypothetical protein